MPSYLAVAQDIQARIEAGEWTTGEQLPTTARLAAQYEVSESTVLHAMRYLGILKIIRTVQGGGRYVAGHDNHDRDTEGTGTDG